MRAEDNVDLGWVATSLVSISGQASQPRRELGWLPHGKLGVCVNGIPAIPELRCTADGASTLPADPDGWVGFLERFGEERDVREATILALKSRVVAGPEFFEGPNIFVGHGAALCKGGQAERLKFLAHPAHAHPNDHTAFGEDI